MILVCNTGPVIALAKIGHLDILRHFGAGERAVVCLAATYQPHAGVLLDDAAGRETACRLGIPVTGFVGVLPAAKQRKLISRVLPLLDQARSSGYWLSDDLVETARQISGE
jgi:predicted nucleic acid-binding protein